VHHVVLDRWSRGRSLLHARDARVKIVALLALLIALATAPAGAHLALAGYLALLIGAVLLAGLPLLPVLWRAAFVLPFSATFAVVSWLSGDAPRAASLVEKSYVSALSVLLVIATTSLPQLMRGLEALRVPRLLVLVIQFVYRYLFVISEEAQHMALASRCRAPVRAGARNWKARFRAAAGALAVLFARSYRRAEGIESAMAARGFSGHFPSFAESRLRTGDFVFLAAALSVTLAVRLGAAL